jgi:anthranilate phosphoribosyltransferase
MAFPDFLHVVVARQNLGADQASQAMNMILEGAVSTAQIAAFLVALRMKGETVEELFGFAGALRAKANRVTVEGPLLDTCGTGGDGQSTFNISTAAAFVAAGAGVRVAKHGNRSISSHCGSADIFEALGIKISLTPPQMAECVRQVGIGFLFAPALHPAMKHAQPARLELKMRTVFNLLGPLANPAGAQAQLIGAPSPEAAELMAGALARLGTGHAFIVHGSDGLDEITLIGPTASYEVRGNQSVRRTLSPEDFDLARAPIGQLRAASLEDSLRLVRSVLHGEPGPARDVVLMNASAALVAAGAAADFRSGVQSAVRSIDSGAARGKVEDLARFTQSL